MTIFYADDDADDRLLFKAALAESGLDVNLVEFDNGEPLEHALSTLGHNCDLVFLDLNMPHRSGLETLHSLQDAILGQGLKVIIFTTSGENDLVEQTHRLNAVRYVKKPTNFSQLVHILKTLVSEAPVYSLPVPYQTYNYRVAHG